MDAVSLPSFSDPPFACPPDIVLDLPPAISVNSSRKIDWQGHSKAKRWREMADRFLLEAKSLGKVRFDRIERFELHVILHTDHVKADADNCLKILIDYLHAREIVANDAPRNLRRIVVEWGHAPAGVRLIVRPCA